MSWKFTQRLGLVAARSSGGISARELLKLVQKPCEEPYWKLRCKGASQDIFFLTIYDKLPGLIDVMNNVADKAGYPASELGVYIQPVVQGTSCHCEFNLFYDPQDNRDLERVKALYNSAVKALLAGGAFFSRPYGENARTIINRDAATVGALNKVKKILDPIIF